MRIENENILFFKRQRVQHYRLLTTTGMVMINLLLKTIQNVNAHRPLMR
jgi:hypothetical protein